MTNSIYAGVATIGYFGTKCIVYGNEETLYLSPLCTPKKTHNVSTVYMFYIICIEKDVQRENVVNNVDMARLRTL